MVGHLHPADGDASAAPLQSGLELWCSGQREEAVALWEHAATADDKVAHLLKSLRSGASPNAANVIGLHHRRSGIVSQEARASLDEAQRLSNALCKLRSYEAAIRVLRVTKREYPNAAGISAAIRDVSGRWLSSLIRRLGSLDLVPRITSEALDNVEDLEGVEEILVLIDGISTYEDILACSDLGRVQTCRLLVALKEREVIRAGRGARSSFAPRRRGRKVTQPMIVAREASATIESSPADISEARAAETHKPSAGAVRRSGSGEHSTPPPTPAVGTNPWLNSAPSAPPAPPSPQPPTGDASSLPDDLPQESPRLSHAVAKEVTNFDDVFKRATRAYLTRDLATALDLFQQCERLRPDDTRVAHNIAAIRQRTRARDDDDSHH